MSYLTQTLSKETVFRDPVHTYIYVQHQIILDLINTTEFQRLRRIKQLGISSLVFPGAEHSRFTHSLGVYEIARQITTHLNARYSSTTANDGQWHPEEQMITLIAALLHDVGHGPYSHTFEHIFNTNHEKFTRLIITTAGTEINTVLSRVSPDFPKKVASILNKTYPNQQVIQIIASQIDADRMDYLLRDAYFTGANYGTFDLSRILRLIRPFQGNLVFSITGMHAIEDYVVSRYQMYLQVYFHPASRAMEVILTNLLKRAYDLYHRSLSDVTIDTSFIPEALLPFLKGQPTLTDYLALDDGVLMTYFGKWRTSDDTILSDLAIRFLDRKPLKSVILTQASTDTLPLVRKLIQQAGFNAQYYTAENDSFNLPYDAYNPHAKNPQTQIELLLPDQSTVELSTVSPLVKSISGRQSGDRRFFFPKEMLETGTNDLFNPIYVDFQHYINNNYLIGPNS
ncbi:HD domain-containing protein [Periweissella beninensis]|uniref:HD domain-containing protein n=1 Tax=Periweissella beninensis TaxID=504936 RepID=A0ABT0VM33_9LACO|nr:HD domain-containing protein [Periweissella beninensis]MBM7543969.1 HD superfamily phosphohydrolase [Periweissella beninensis]MCM2437979.1 HD domain-containing protein [Periweissella beninensis]MCT4395695.1 HD domain-containing protein [Periweissella beninensis]